MKKTMEQTINGIAVNILDLETLESRNSDSLDFHELAVWHIKEALEVAYREGAKTSETQSAPEEPEDGCLKYTSMPMGNWTKGTVGGFDFTIKHFDEVSYYGIDEGRISKLEIRKGYKTLANYDRGWDIEVPEEAQAAYTAILAEFN